MGISEAQIASVLSVIFSAMAGAGFSWLVLNRRIKTRFQRRFDKRSRFIGAIAHQLRTPLNQVLGMAQSLSVHSDQLTPELKSLVDTLTDSGANLKTAMLDVLDMLDLTTNELALDINAAYLPQTIDTIRRVYEPEAKKNNTTIDFEVSPSARKWFNYDEVRLRQCISAPVRQCIRQSPNGNVRVTVSVNPIKKRTDKSSIRIVVEDSSRGMDQWMAERYFSPTQYKINQFMRNAESTVLSLSLSRLLMRKMGGNLSVKSAFSNGVTFTLRLPAEIPANAAQLEQKTATDTKQAAEALRDACVMIVEDNNVNIQILQLFLNGVNPKRIIVAHNGQEALNLLHTQSCDLILMDIQMPVMDGITATQKIRESDETWRNLPILAVTAAARGTERDACAKAGVTDFLAKPVIVDELYRKIARVMHS